MADELTITATLKFVPSGGAKVERKYEALTFTVAGVKSSVMTQEIGTSAENLDYGDVSAANAEYLAIKNLDGTNYVELLISGETAFAKLAAGQIALIPIAGVQI